MITKFRKYQINENFVFDGVEFNDIKELIGLEVVLIDRRNAIISSNGRHCYHTSNSIGWTFKIKSVKIINEVIVINGIDDNYPHIFFYKLNNFKLKDNNNNDNNIVWWE